MFIDRALDTAFLIRRGGVEVGVKPPRNICPRTPETREEEPFAFVVVDADAELTAQLARHLDDLGGIAHTSILLFQVFPCLFLIDNPRATKPISGTKALLRGTGSARAGGPGRFSPV